MQSGLWIILLPFLIYGAILIHVFMKRSVQFQLGRKAIKRAEKIGGVFRINENAGIFAICTTKDFEAGFTDYTFLRESGKPCPDWVWISAFPTFSFSLEQKRTLPQHTSDLKRCDLVINKLIALAVGIDPEEIPYGDYVRVRDIIFVDDHRLFVPFSGGLLARKWQETHYPKYRVEDAFGYLQMALA